MTRSCKSKCQQGTHGTGKTGKMAKKKSLSGKRQGIWKFYQNTGKTHRLLSKHKENTGNNVSSSCKCSDSKSKGYCDSCCKMSGLKQPDSFLDKPGPITMPWKTWVAQFENYLVASGGTNYSVARKKALLLHCLVKEGQRVFQILLDHDNPPAGASEYDKALLVLEKHFGPKTNVVAECYKLQRLLLQLQMTRTSTPYRRPSTRKSTSLPVQGLQKRRLLRVQNKSSIVIDAVRVSIKQTMISVWPNMQYMLT